VSVITAPAPAGTIPIAEVAWRHRARVSGRVHSMRVQPWGGVPTVECTIVDESGGVIVVFLGRRAVPGIGLGRRMAVEGMVGERRGHLAILNPDYELLHRDERSMDQDREARPGGCRPALPALRAPSR
jgi:RecJ-like exonuclease